MKKTKKPKAKGYTFTLTIGGKKYVGRGETAFDALSALVNPGKVMAKGVLLVEHNGHKNEQLLMPPKIKQLFFTSANLRMVKAKQLAMGL